MANIETGLPAPPEITEAEKPVETRPQPEKKELSEQEITEAYESLDTLQAELPGKDIKMELITSLGQPEDKFLGHLKVDFRQYKEEGNEAGIKKLQRINYLRRLITDEKGPDHRAEEVINRCYEHVNDVLKKAVETFKSLQALPKNPETEMRIDKSRQLVSRLSKNRQNIEHIIQTGYPELWEKLHPSTSNETQSENKSAEEQAIDQLFADETPPAEAGATITKPNAETAEQEGKKELEKIKKLESIIEQRLPPQYKEMAPRITQVLMANGFSINERQFATGPKGKEQTIERLSLWLDPRKQIHEGELNDLRQQTLKSSYTNGVDHFKTFLKNMVSDNRLNALAVRALFEKGDWDYPEPDDAETILKSMHTGGQAIATYVEDPKDRYRNLINIGATSGDISRHHHDEGMAPTYLDNKTFFFSTPIYNFDKKQKL